MKTKLLIYGANGYTGELIAKHAVQQGLKPILAGRSKEKLQPLATELKLEIRAFGLDKPFDKHLHDVAVVLHCAGPFQYTYKAVADTCLTTGTHYLDITGEYEVFEALAARNNEALKNGVLLLPGTGFDVVPSDCLANHLKLRLPSANELTMGFFSPGRPSRGTSKTVVESMGKGGAIRKDGKIVKVKAGYRTAQLDFGDGTPRWAATIPWGDISTAWHSTGIPNISIFMGMHGKQAQKLKYLNIFGWFFNLGPIKNYLKAQIDKKQAGPSAEAREKGYTLMWGKVTNEMGAKAESFMKVPEGYQLTMLTSVEIAKRVLAGNFQAGFQTPATLYGAEFIQQFNGVTLIEK